MKSLVVDASVAIKWYLAEIHSDKALALLARQTAGELAFHVPDLFLSEFGNILWKKVRRTELNGGEALAIGAALLQVPKTIHPMERLFSSALRLALATGRTVYDSVYLALAAALDCPLVTADAKFFSALAGTRWQTLVRWIEDT